MAERGIVVKNIQDVQIKLKKLGIASKKSRTLINKALRPAGNILVKEMQRQYQKEFNYTYYDSAKKKTIKLSRKPGRTPTYKTIGIVTARRSKNPGIFVGPVKKKTTPIKVDGKDSYNLTQLQILGFNRYGKRVPGRKDIFESSARKVEGQVIVKAEKDLDKLVEKMIRKAGLR
jgi:hypothetical protein